MEKEELREVVCSAVKEGVAAHKCFLDAEGQQIVKDAVTGGKYFKRAIILGIVFLALGGLGFKWLKPFIAK